MTRRVVIVLDALRRDTAKWILLPYFDAKFHEVQNLGNATPTVFNKICSFLNGFSGWRGIITGGGFPTIALRESGIRINYFNEGSLFPLFDVKGCLPTAMPLVDTSAILIIHNYFIHNYFDDVEGQGVLPKDFKVADKEKMLVSYALRAHALIPFIMRERRRFHDWEFYVTADHGEAFWETDNKCHHGVDCPEVLDGFILDFQKRDVLTQEMLFRGE